MIDRGLGLDEGIVALSPYNRAWIEAFDDEATALKTLLRARAIRIEHVGSTAIPSIRAKPILDLLLGLGELGDGHNLAVELASLGYAFRPHAGVPEEHVFVKGTPRTHILHVVEHGGGAWRQKLAFRDALRQQPELAREYNKLKTMLAARYPDNRPAYTAGKTEFVRKVVEACIPDLSLRSRDTPTF